MALMFSQSLKKTVRSFVTTLMPVVRKDVAGSKEMLTVRDFKRSSIHVGRFQIERVKTATGVSLAGDFKLTTDLN